MNHDDYRHLLAEQKQLFEILGKMTEEDVIDRMSVQARLEDIETTLAKNHFERLSQKNLVEQSQLLEGEFQGVLPKRRTFEFIPAGETEIITGKVGPAIQDAAPLNSLLGQPVRVKVMATRVGNGRPRFLLLEEPELLKKSA